MAFSVRYRMLSPSPLSGADRLAVVRLVVRHNRQRWVDGAFPLWLANAARPDEQVAFGRVDWRSEEDVDLPRFLTAVTELRVLVPSVGFSLVDSGGRIGWRGGKRDRYLVGERPTDRADLADPSDLATGWTDAVASVMPPGVAISAELREAIASAVCGMSMPVKGLRAPHVSREAYACLRALAGEGPGDLRFDAVAAVIAHLHRYTPEARNEGLRARPTLPPAAQQIVDSLGPSAA